MQNFPCPSGLRPPHFSPPAWPALALPVAFYLGLVLPAGLKVHNVLMLISTPSASPHLISCLISSLSSFSSASASPCPNCTSTFSIPLSSLAQDFFSIRPHLHSHIPTSTPLPTTSLLSTRHRSKHSLGSTKSTHTNRHKQLRTRATTTL
jgi:hypothetical protein